MSNKGVEAWTDMTESTVIEKVLFRIMSFNAAIKRIEEEFNVKVPVSVTISLPLSNSVPYDNDRKKGRRE